MSTSESSAERAATKPRTGPRRPKRKAPRYYWPRMATAVVLDTELVVAIDALPYASRSAYVESLVRADLARRREQHEQSAAEEARTL